MKGLAIESLASTPPLRKKSLSNTSNVAIAIPKGFQENLLQKSLTTKLKQRQNNNNKENASRIISAKPPKQARKSSMCVSSKKDHSDSRLSKNNNNDSNNHKDTFIHERISRTGSGVSSVHSDFKETSGRPHRIDSAASDKLPHISAREDNASSKSSRRTTSADPFISFGAGSVGSGRISRISASTSFYPCSESTGLAFDSSGTDYTIKVIKRDGVFQPIDKYAPGRQGSRDVEFGCRGLACDYELFTLPLCEDTGGTNSFSLGKQSTLPVSRGGKSDNSKKSMRVSWYNVMENGSSPNMMEILENRMEINSTPVIPFPNSRTTMCKDNMAFKRPVYSSGKSGIKSIGVKWTVPTVATPEDEETQRQLPSALSSTSSKPMWSWLITPEPVKNKTKQSTRVKSVGQLSRTSKTKESPTPSSLGRSASMFDIRTQHCRDVHPVATAMDRQGTSVTKTKWHVPSSTSSTLNAKQVAMERLQMVKRPGKKIVYESGTYRDDSGAVTKFQNGDGDEEDVEDDDIQDADYIKEYKAMMMKDMDDGITTTTGTTRRDDANSSPTKSMSTFN